MTSQLRRQAMLYMAGNLTCQDVAEIVTEYLEGAMPFWRRIRFQMHLGLCFACRNYLRQMKYTIQTLGALPSTPISPQVREELLRRFRDWKRQ